MLACGLAAAMWLGGCASVQTPPNAAAAQQMFQGRLALRADATPTRDAQAFTARFALVSFGADAGTLRLTSTIGLQLAEARWSSQGASLDTGRGPVAYGDLSELGEAVFGQPVPLAALEHWLAGRPAPGLPSEPAPGGFVQSDWAITTTDLAARGVLLAERRVPSAVTVRVQLDAFHVSQPASQPASQSASPAAS